MNSQKIKTENEKKNKLLELNYLISVFSISILLISNLCLYAQQEAKDSAWSPMTTGQMLLQHNVMEEETNVMDDYGKKLSRKALQLHKDLVELYISSGEYAEALAKCNMLLTYDWDIKEKIEIISKKGAAHEGLKQYDMALKSYLECRELAPGNPAYYLALARIYDITGMEGQAIVEYKKVIELSGDKFTAAGRLGRIYEQRGLYSKAIEHYKQALLVKSTPQLYEALARCYEMAGEWEMASMMLKQAMSSQPESPSVENVIRLAFLYSILGKYDDSLNHLIEADAREPKDEEIKAHISAIYFKKGDYEKARSVAQEYLEKNPASALTHFIIGFIYYFEGKKDKVANEMSAVLALNPTPMLKEYAEYIVEHLKRK
ncbi:MAG: tetratricopeptide repeat protein [Elusimicrobiota bacterium]